MEKSCKNQVLDHECFSCTCKLCEMRCIDCKCTWLSEGYNCENCPCPSREEEDDDCEFE